MKKELFIGLVIFSLIGSVFAQTPSESNPEPVLSNPFMTQPPQQGQTIPQEIIAKCKEIAPDKFDECISMYKNDVNPQMRSIGGGKGNCGNTLCEENLGEDEFNCGQDCMPKAEREKENLMATQSIPMAMGQGFALPPEFAREAPFEEILLSKMSEVIFQRFTQKELEAMCPDTEKITNTVFDYVSTQTNFSDICSPIEQGLNQCLESRKYCDNIGEKQGPQMGPYDIKMTCPPNVEEVAKACKTRFEEEEKNRSIEEEERSEIECELEYERNAPHFQRRCEDFGRIEKGEMGYSQPPQNVEEIREERKQECPQMQPSSQQELEQCYKNNGKPEKIMDPRGCFQGVKCIQGQRECPNFPNDVREKQKNECFANKGAPREVFENGCVVAISCERQQTQNCPIIDKMQFQKQWDECKAKGAFPREQRQGDCLLGVTCEAQPPIETRPPGNFPVICPQISVSPMEKDSCAQKGGYMEAMKDPSTNCIKTYECRMPSIQQIPIASETVCPQAPYQQADSCKQNGGNPEEIRDSRGCVTNYNCKMPTNITQTQTITGGSGTSTSADYTGTTTISGGGGTGSSTNYTGTTTVTGGGTSTTEATTPTSSSTGGGGGASTPPTAPASTDTAQQPSGTTATPAGKPTQTILFQQPYIANTISQSPSMRQPQMQSFGRPTEYGPYGIEMTKEIYCSKEVFASKCLEKRKEEFKKNYGAPNQAKICELEAKRMALDFGRYCKDIQRGKDDCKKRTEEGCNIAKAQLEKCQKYSSKDKIKEIISSKAKEMCAAKKYKATTQAKNTFGNFINTIENSSQNLTGDLKPWVEGEKSRIIDVAGELDSVQADEAKKDMMYQISKFFGAQAKKEQAEAERIKKSVAKIDSTIKSLKKVMEQIPDEAVKKQLNERIAELEIEKNRWSGTAKQKEADAAGIFSFFKGLFGG